MPWPTRQAPPSFRKAHPEGAIRLNHSPDDLPAIDIARFDDVAGSAALKRRDQRSDGQAASPIDGHNCAAARHEVRILDAIGGDGPSGKERAARNLADDERTVFNN